MNVGDLVRLSTYGRRFADMRPKEPPKVGIITEIKWYGQSYSVLWSDGKKTRGLDKRDIEHVRNKQ